MPEVTDKADKTVSYSGKFESYIAVICSNNYHT
jgi:hypothetical protein